MTPSSYSVFGNPIATPSYLAVTPQPSRSLNWKVIMEVSTRQQQMSQDADWLVEFTNKYFARGSQPKPGEACSLQLVLQRPEYLVAIDCLPDGTISSIATVEHGNAT